MVNFATFDMIAVSCYENDDCDLVTSIGHFWSEKAELNKSADSFFVTIFLQMEHARKKYQFLIFVKGVKKRRSSLQLVRQCPLNYLKD